jgi:hypothetical protein
VVVMAIQVVHVMETRCDVVVVMAIPIVGNEDEPASKYEY